MAARVASAERVRYNGARLEAPPDSLMSLLPSSNLERMARGVGMRRRGTRAVTEGRHPMAPIVLAGISGWVVAALTAVTLTLPRALRARAMSAAVAPEASKGISFLRRLWPHYLLGYLIGGLSVIHAEISFGWSGRSTRLAYF